VDLEIRFDVIAKVESSMNTICVHREIQEGRSGVQHNLSKIAQMAGSYNPSHIPTHSRG
jgi:hypothetical protein